MFESYAVKAIFVVLNKASNHLKYEPFFHLSLKGFHHEVRPMSETFATHLNFSYWNQVYNEMSFFFSRIRSSCMHSCTNKRTAKSCSICAKSILRFFSYLNVSGHAELDIVPQLMGGYIHKGPPHPNVHWESVTSFTLKTQNINSTSSS